MNKERLFGFSFLLSMGVASSQVPSVSEYDRAVKAITQMIGDSQELPTTVRLGRKYCNNIFVTY